MYTSQKVKFLSNKSNYPDISRNIEVRETHMSWVFLLDYTVYKLKKPVHYNSIDFRTLELRYQNCREEVRLNKRLSKGIYLDIIPLTVNEDRSLQIGGKGLAIDWLVKMKRLPENLMLDYIIKQKSAHLFHVKPAAIMLSEFYGKSLAAETSARKYKIWLKEDILTNKKDLLSPEYDLPKQVIEDIASDLLHFINSNSSVFEKRVKDGKIIEAHGDLRPEHICLTTPPAIIDCLEFSKKLRTLDIAEELSFLAIECEMLGVPEIGNFFYRTNEEINDDEIPTALIYFYKSKRAFLRVKFTIWHIKETQYKSDPKWIKRANAYLLIAQKYVSLLKE